MYATSCIRAENATASPWRGVVASNFSSLIKLLLETCTNRIQLQTIRHIDLDRWQCMYLALYYDNLKQKLSKYAHEYKKIPKETCKSALPCASTGPLYASSSSRGCIDLPRAFKSPTQPTVIDRLDSPFDHRLVVKNSNKRKGLVSLL